MLDTQFFSTDRVQSGRQKMYVPHAPKRRCQNTLLLVLLKLQVGV
jgi:hypothetical protein